MTVRRLSTLLALFLVITPWADAADFKLTLPLGLQEHSAYIPEDNPLTAEKIALGKMFFWDKRWSRNGTIACGAVTSRPTGGPIPGPCPFASTESPRRVIRRHW